MGKEHTGTQSRSQVWFKFHQTYDAMAKYEEKFFSKYNLTPQQFLVLGAITRLKTPVTQKSVARSLERHPYSISLIIDRMTRDGLVKRVKNTDDRRSTNLVITRKGKEAFEPALKAGRILPNKILSSLSQEDLTVFYSLLNAIHEKSIELGQTAGTESHLPAAADKKKSVK